MKNEPEPPALSESAFPRGTRFFSDDGEPVAMIPGVGPVNFAGMSGVIIPLPEFGRNNPVSGLSWHEFVAKATEPVVRNWVDRPIVTMPRLNPTSQPILDAGK